MKPPLLLALLVGTLPLRAQSPDALRAEAKSRHEALVREGYNLTHGFRLGAGAKGAPVRHELLFPEKSERTLALWFAAENGEVSARFTGPDGKAVMDLAARRGEWVAERELPAGRYLLEITGPANSAGEALLGVKGSVVSACRTDAARVREVAAAPAAGFHWPYLLFVPERAAAGRLLVAPNNSGFATEELALLRASGSCTLADEAGLASALGAPLLVPLFPRPIVSTSDHGNLYLHALTREALEARTPAWKRVDLQLLAMIRDARTRLKGDGVDASGRVLLTGFSASGSFVNRFAMLHPDEVLAVACGSPGGWPLAPVAEHAGEKLPYPVGLADVAALAGRPPDPAALRAVRWLFFLGDHDENDAVVHRDSFSAADEALVLRLFGATPVARFPKAGRLYADAGLAARFVLDPGAAHEVTPAMRKEIERFFAAALGAAR